MADNEDINMFRTYTVTAWRYIWRNDSFSCRSIHWAHHLVTIEASQYNICYIASSALVTRRIKTFKDPYPVAQDVIPNLPCLILKS